MRRDCFLHFASYPAEIQRLRRISCIQNVVRECRLIPPAIASELPFFTFRKSRGCAPINSATCSRAVKLVAHSLQLKVHSKNSEKQFTVYEELGDRHHTSDLVNYRL